MFRIKMRKITSVLLATLLSVSLFSVGTLENVSGTEKVIIEPSYGYEISRQIKTLSHEKYIIKETTLYSAFTRMEKNGYITSFQDQNTATGKRRTYYRITGKGRAYYQEKCEEWLLTQEVVEQFIRKGETENGSY